VAEPFDIGSATARQILQFGSPTRRKLMVDHVSSPILQPVTIGDLHLKNRIVMAPMTRSRSDEPASCPTTSSIIMHTAPLQLVCRAP